MESSWTSRHVCCIDNVAIVLPTKVSLFKLACLMEGHRSSSFSLWFSNETCLIEWYQVLRHICWSFIKRHPCIATRSSHQTFLPAHMQIMWYWNSTHVCLLPRCRIFRHVCLLHHTSNNVCYNCTRQQECWVIMHWISVHVCYTHTRPATQPLLLQGQWTSLPFPCFIMHTCLKPRLQVSSYICNSFTRLSGLLQKPFL